MTDPATYSLMSNPAAAAREAAISVEVRLSGYAKRSDGGVSLRFTVHPNDASKLVDAALGTRYLMALVALDDNEEPKAPPNQLVKQAAMACKDPRFWRYLHEIYHGVPEPVDNEEEAVRLVRNLCGVQSRAELMPNTMEGDAWNRLYSKYIAWRET